jgi:hypothetical protein
VVAPDHKTNWEQFKANVQMAFGDSDHATTVWIKIKEIRQGRDSADDYVIKFEEFEMWTGFDEMVLIEQFKEGLAPPTLS